MRPLRRGVGDTYLPFLFLVASSGHLACSHFFLCHAAVPVLVLDREALTAGASASDDDGVTIADDSLIRTY